MSVSVPRRGAARGCPVRSCWPRRRGSPVCSPAGSGQQCWPSTRPRQHVRALASARRRRRGRQPV